MSAPMPWLGRTAQAWAILMLALSHSVAQPAPVPVPLTGSAATAIEQFLRAQAAGQPGDIAIAVSMPTSGPLPPCHSPVISLPNGARAWGRVSVGVRCAEGSAPWARYVPAYVSIVANYYVAVRQIAAGQALAAGDYATQAGDLTKLPRGIIVSPAELEGVVAVNAIAPGAPLRRELVRGAIVVRQGQVVRLVSRGAGFAVSTEGTAMTNAAVGVTVQIKTSGGQLLSGVVRDEGLVERPN